MTSRSDALYELAREAIQRVFSDTSVSPAETRTTLRTLAEEIETLIESIPEGEDE